MIRRLLLLTMIMLVTACATAPVQEMSDARQAIRSAQAADAAHYSPNQLRAALQSMRKAQIWLDQGAYANAMQYAVDARQQAIHARDTAVAASSAK